MTTFRALALAVAAASTFSAAAAAQTLPFDAPDSAEPTAQDQAKGAGDGSKNFQISKMFTCDTGNCVKTIYKTGDKERLIIKYFACAFGTNASVYFAGIQNKASFEFAGVAPQSNGGNYWVGSQAINLVFGPKQKIVLGVVASAGISGGNCTISGVRE